MTSSAEENLNKLPTFIDHEIDFEDGVVSKERFFLSLNRSLDGTWACGYVRYADETTDELAIPELVTNSSTSLSEVATRMLAKVERYTRRHNVHP